ncbi:uncharacterized protein LOC126767135, partial [Bactrocera neohumeralis]|uniref:uncharacterized protein LOC126767135 n=1 Tax=Bactrocera neohumeralis TaxID=98809 RepID=UPI002165F8FF
MSNLVAPLSNKVISYVDEVIIASHTEDENLLHVKEFLEIIEQEGLTLRLSKCTFMRRAVSFLGHEVNEGGVRPGAMKTRAIKNFPVPRNQLEVRRFLGLTGFFRKFVSGYALIAKPLTELTRKNIDFVWSITCEDAFRKLIDHITNSPVLTIYDVTKVHELHTDASSVGLAAILLQYDDTGNLKPVAYFSRACTEAEKNYHAYELEVLAVVEACQRFRTFLLGKHFTVVTDCQAISCAKLTTPMRPRVARWLLRLLEYDYDIVHRAGTSMCHVDAMSRGPVKLSNTVNKEGTHIQALSVDDWVSVMQQQDSKLRIIIDVLRGLANSDQQAQIKSEYLLENHRLFKRNMKDSCPLRVVTDRGTAFTSTTFTSYCNTNNIQHVKVAVRTPRSNGLAERVNQAVLAYLKPSIGNPRDWDIQLRSLQWVMNTKVNSTTKYAPIDLVYDFPLRDISGNKVLAAIHDDDVQLLMNKRRDEATRNIETARAKWKARFDAKHSKPEPYAESDLVLLAAPVPSTGESRKLQPHYKGPYIVKKVLRFNRYVVEDVDGHQCSQRRYSTIATTDNMKPWCVLFPEVDDEYDESG